jgi:uncharacterized membrane protein (UPF0127 family)
MAWLVSDARVLASAEIAADRRARRRGLLGRDGIEGALVIERCRWVHTLGMRFAIAVAFFDADGVVIKPVTMNRWRVGAPARRARMTIEAEAGGFERWGLGVGESVELRLVDDRSPDDRGSGGTATDDPDPDGG